MKKNISIIEEIIILANKYNIKKIKFKNKHKLIEIHKNNTKITIKKNNEINKEIKIIKSPFAGIFYTKPSPTKEPFVKKGDKIKIGDTICIIEIMKTLHKIKSNYTGIIEKIIVKNETPIEYNDDLFIIKNV